MALQNTNQSASELKVRPELNMPMFWEKPTEFPPMAWEQWRNRFHVALLAKYDIDTEDIQD